jgi:hypothetical protein
MPPFKDFSVDFVAGIPSGLERRVTSLVLERMKPCAPTKSKAAEFSENPPAQTLPLNRNFLHMAPAFASHRAKERLFNSFYAAMLGRELEKYFTNRFVSC